MGVTASFRSVTAEQLGRARQNPSYAARLLNETPEGDETPLDSNLSVQRRTFSIQRFSLDLWEGLVWDAPVNVFMGGDYLDLDWDYDEEDDEEDEDEDPSQAMELDPDLIATLADWLRGVRFRDVCDEADDDGFVHDDYGFVSEQDFEEFRTFILAVAERGEGALFHFG
ncbi:hypothetical protein ACH4U7_14850 [Streptomyces sp. NPDC020845]|uniref:hypothetical protein n=1 Tax=Streptomyces sp. NPDC020845 TaxID=3365096 RepID=UPI00378EC281